MYKSLSLVLALNVLSAMGYAQTNLDAEVDAELNQMYSAPASSAAKSEAVASAASAQAPVSSQPLYIVNPATGAATASSAAVPEVVQVQKQPTTVIEASPLTESRAESLRKARQDAEMSTEAKIVEKLEQSRLEDEKRRAQLLFGDKLQSEAAKAEAPAAAPAAPVVAPQPQIIIVPQAAPVQPAAIEKKEEAKAEEPAEQEVQAATKLESSLALDPIQPVMKKYFSAIIGVTEVNDADYVKGNYSMGFSFGTRYNDTYAVEGSFLYSNYEVENINNVRWIDSLDLFDVNQYSGNVALKYFFLQGMVRPVLGGLAQYSYREFRWSDKNGVKPFNMSDSNSHAFDVGGIMGVEIQFSPTMTLGFDVRYIRNVAVNRNYSTSELRYLGGAAPTQQQISDWQYGFRTPIEELDHYLYGLSFQVAF
ncbi:MAG: hypothetical protein ACK5Y2_08530 [Bdellovibrionales bacterium]